MRSIFFWLTFPFLFTHQMLAQTEEASYKNWPKEIVGKNYTVNIYQPQNESYSITDNTIVSRSAFFDQTK